MWGVYHLTISRDKRHKYIRIYIRTTTTFYNNNKNYNNYYSSLFAIHSFYTSYNKLLQTTYIIFPFIYTYTYTSTYSFYFYSTYSPYIYIYVYIQLLSNLLIPFLSILLIYFVIYVIRKKPRFARFFTTRLHASKRFATQTRFQRYRSMWLASLALNSFSLFTYTYMYTYTYIYV